MNSTTGVVAVDPSPFCATGRHVTCQQMRAKGLVPSLAASPTVGCRAGDLPCGCPCHGGEVAP